MSQVSTCAKYGGDGKMISDHCRKCGVRGLLQSKRNINVVIPPGITDGATMQDRGEGNIDQKRGVAGDLYLVLHIEEKRGIQREGLNLYSTIEVDYAEAILGTVVKTLNVMLQISIKPLVQIMEAEALRMCGSQSRASWGKNNLEKSSHRSAWRHQHCGGLTSPYQVVLL